MSDILELLQWPAMAASLLAAWLALTNVRGIVKNEGA